MYIGEQKIDRIEDTMVYFKDWKSKQYTHKQLTYLVTKKVKDASALRTLVMDNVMPDIEAVLVGENASDIALKVFEVLEAHDITNADLQYVLQRIQLNRVEQYNILLKEKMWDETEKFSKDMEQRKEISQIISDSYNKAMYVASWIAFGTYEKDKPAESCLDDIRMSDIARLTKSL